MTNKNDVELERLRISAEKFSSVCGAIKHLVSVVGIIVSFKIIMVGLEPFLASNPEVIKAMALVIEKINFSNITGYLLTCGTGVGWYIERRGKKRAIEQKGKYQKRAENADEYRSSSGLTNDGETPEGGQ